MRDYKELWRGLRADGYETLARAAAFYAKTPDGQYDDIAERAILAVIEQMKRDDAAKQRPLT